MRTFCSVFLQLLSGISLTFGQTLINHRVLSGNGSDLPTVIATDSRGFVYMAYGNGVPDLVWQNDTTRQVNQCFLWLYLQFHDLQIQYRDAAEHRNPQHLRKIREPSLMPSLRVVHGQLSDPAPGAPACYRWLPSFGEEM
jgi:hypothetical protein